MFFVFHLAVPEPVAFYPLNAGYKAAEKENRQPSGTVGDVSITNGPYNKPGGAYMFYGTVGSYITFPNIGGLDTLPSLTVMCWVQSKGLDGPLIGYRRRDAGIQIDRGRLSFYLRLNRWSSVEVLPTEEWVHVAATYNYSVNNVSLYINGHSRALHRSIRARSAIATNINTVRIGVGDGDNQFFKGNIAEIKLYDVALNDNQIQTSIIQGS